MYTEIWNTMLHFLFARNNPGNIEWMLEIFMTTSLIPEELFWINDITVNIKSINND